MRKQDSLFPLNYQMFCGGELLENQSTNGFVVKGQYLGVRRVAWVE